MGQRGLITSPLPVNQGGTGVRSLSADSVLVGNADSPIDAIALPANKQVLRSNGTNWAPREEGKILQVLQFETGTLFTNTSATYIPVFNFAITTRSANSRILLVLALSSAKSAGNTWGGYRLTRVTTSPVFNDVVYTFGWPFGLWQGGPNNGLYLATVDGLWLDSPGVASGQSVNYTISLRNGSGGVGGVQMNFTNLETSTAMLFEVAT